MDFAVTSGLSDRAMVDSVTDAQACLLRYEDYKCDYMDTKKQCQEEGMDVLPMVVEASGGGWGKEACRVWSESAKTNAQVSGDLQSSVAVQALR
eukprot:12402230-Karenia_brevis.AAC.1